MELSQLKQFYIVAKLEHITKASFQLHVAQPALSRTIKSLENELGVLLFTRSNKSVHLNENGKILFNYSEKIQTLLQEMKKTIAAKNSLDHRTIRILLRDIPPSLTWLIQGFQAVCPDVHFQIATYMENIPIYDGQFDFELRINSSADNEYNSIPLQKDFLVAAVSKDHPLAHTQSVDLREWEDSTFLLFSIDSTSYTSSKSISDYLKDLDFYPKTILKCTDYQTMCGLIKENIGIGITTRYMWDETTLKDIALIPISGKQFDIVTCILWKKQLPLSPICETFKTYILSVTKGL